MSLSSKVNYSLEALSGITVGNINITKSLQVGGNIFNSAGNLGIGTTSPTTTLHVYNQTNPYTMILDGGNSAGGMRISSSTNYLELGVAITSGSWSSSASTGDSVIRTNKNLILQASYSGSSHIFIQTSGNVGIGTTSPVYTLDVNGTFEASNSNGLILFAPSGNVGIGTTAPGYTLDVRTTTSGLYTYTGNFLSPNITTGQQAGIVLGKANSGNNVCEIRHFHAGDGSNQNMLRIGSSGLDNIMSIRYDGNIGIGTTAPSFKLDVNGTIRASGPGGAGSNGSVLITGADSYGHSLYIASSSGTQKRMGFNHNGTTGNIFAYDYGALASQNLILQTPGGNVGIHTTSADCRLVVNRGATSSDIIPTTGLGGSTCFNFYHSSAASDYGLIGGITSMTGLVWLQSKYTATSGTLPMALQPLGGNVGIGTTAPIATLDFGPGGGSKKIGLAVQGTNFWGLGAANSAIEYQVPSDSEHRFYTGSTTTALGTERMRISTSGNVGIGTGNPTQMLHIQKFGSDNYIKVDAGSTNNNNYAGIMFTEHNINFGWSLRFNALNDGLYISHQDNTPAFTDLVSFNRANNSVGINTTSPAYNLDVNGTIARSGVKLPRFDNGTFSGTTAVIPILFNDTQYNYVEIKVRYQVSTLCNVTLSGSTSSNGSTPFAGVEIGETTVKNSSQASPIYTNLGYISQNTEQLNIDNNFTIKIIRASGGSNARNHYTFDTVYCFAGFGTTRVYGMGHFTTATNLSNALLSIVMTPGAGTISGTYSTHHSY